MASSDLLTVDTHFALGEDWKSFVGTIDDDSVRPAERGLSRLLSDTEIRGKRFLDIGCGSGLSMLAGAKLGAANVVRLDIDPSSVAAARTLLASKLSGDLTAYALTLIGLGRNPPPFVRGRRTDRGMDPAYDPHNWMGVYFYESASPEEVTGFLGRMGFSTLRFFTHSMGFGSSGSGCDEDVEIRVTATWEGRHLGG